MNRRRFFKLLSSVPLALGLRLPTIDESKADLTNTKKWLSRQQEAIAEAESDWVSHDFGNYKGLCRMEMLNSIYEP